MDMTETWLCDSPDATPLNGRTITMHCYESEGVLEAVGRLTDTRHWASVLGPDGIIHDMELRLRVDRESLTITAVKATMYAHPHEECPEIAPAFQQLVGISVMRGYTRTVQELLGRVRGCSHLEFLARAMGPVVIQGATSLSSRERIQGGSDAAFQQGAWMKDTCHIWAEDGPAPVKLQLGWRPGTVYPAPSVAKLRAQLEGESGS